jgi:hypothetical protein
MPLLRGIARTAVVAGTATAVSNRVSRRQAARWGAQDPGYGYAEPPPPPPPPPAPPAAAGGEDLVEQLTKLAQLKDQGILTDEEFAVQKAKLLA